MKKQLNIQKGKKYLVAFIFVMLLNLGLGAFLLHRTLAQTSKSDYRNQPPLVAEASSQKNSPLLITIINVDNSPSSYQTVNYTVQNISGQPIRGYVILGSGKDTGKIVTNFFPVKSFQVDSINQDELNLERSNIQPSDILSLSIDYVEFEDGSSWGIDSQGQSEHIAGGRAGVESATEQLKSLVDKRETASLNALLERDLVDIDVPLPNSVQSEKWRKGFEKGYKGVVYFLKGQSESGIEKISEKLDEIKRKNQTERRQKQ